MHGAHRAFAIGRRLLAARAARCALFVCALLAIAARPLPAHAEERISVLTRMLGSSSDKTRLAAVLALAKLGNHAAQKPLIQALRDRNVRVRAVAATALGSLGCEPALPVLRSLATDDADPDVRKAANTATMKITYARTTRPPDARGKPDGEAMARRAPGSTGHGRVSGIDDEPHPDLFVMINSSSDDSPGSPDKAARKLHADAIKRVLTEQCQQDASITSAVSEAQRWGLEARHIDLSVTRLDVTRIGSVIAIDVQLRLAISDDHGRMLSFLTGGAKLDVPVSKFDARHLPALRREVLENAMRGMFDKLLAHLRESAPG
jgi:HEAT repeats